MILSRKKHKKIPFTYERDKIGLNATCLLLLLVIMIYEYDMDVKKKSEF